MRHGLKLMRMMVGVVGSKLVGRVFFVSGKNDQPISNDSVYPVKRGKILVLRSVEQKLHCRFFGSNTLCQETWRKCGELWVRSRVIYGVIFCYVICAEAPTDLLIRAASFSN